MQAFSLDFFGLMPLCLAFVASGMTERTGVKGRRYFFCGCYLCLYEFLYSYPYTIPPRIMCFCLPLCAERGGYLLWIRHEVLAAKQLVT